MIWYKESVTELYKILETSEGGISNEEVTLRQKKYGLNKLTSKTESFWQIIIEPFKSIFVIVLLVAMAVSLLSQEYVEGVVIAVIIAINTLIFYSQKYATGRVLNSLKQHDKHYVSVIRNNTNLVVLVTELVPGDLVKVSAGDRVPADGRVVHSEALQVDEASLTGESVPITKHASVLEKTRPLYEQDNMVFQGTYAVAGMATVLVVATGKDTEFAQIVKLADQDAVVSPVQEKIDNLIQTIVRVISMVAVLVFVLSLARGISADEALKFVMSLAVSAVPEGLPVAISVIVVIGMRRLAKDNALVRSFKSLEDIGLVTTIATDKTGTLTKNHLAVVETWSLENDDVMLAASKTLDAKDIGDDPLDIAIYEKSKTLVVSSDKIYPFDLKTRMSGSYLEKERIVYIKGAPEHVLLKTQLSKTQVKLAESVIHELASKGYRVVAVAKMSVHGRPPINLSLKKSTIEFIGFIAFSDELRSGVKRAVNMAQKAGIKVNLLTGDHFETAYNIGKQVGIANHIDQVIKGEDLPRDERTMAYAIEDKTVFARILPEDKFNVLKALKLNHITAMTGDGVNDVPAIANAHVGIAMGSGSDIAKDASGIVLLDNNFATIVRAIAEGRRLYDNIRRMIFYLLSTSLGEVMVMVGALLVGLPLPVTAIQILWINLVTDTFLVLPLGLEASERDVMTRPPKKVGEPLLSKVMTTRLIIVSLSMALSVLIVVAVVKAFGVSDDYIHTIAFMALIAPQWVNAFNARSNHESIIDTIKRPNISIWIGLAIAVMIQIAVMISPLGAFLGIEAVPVWILIVSSIFTGGVTLAVVEAHKAYERKKRS